MQFVEALDDPKLCDGNSGLCFLRMQFVEECDDSKLCDKNCVGCFFRMQFLGERQNSQLCDKNWQWGFSWLQFVEKLGNSKLCDGNWVCGFWWMQFFEELDYSKLCDKNWVSGFWGLSAGVIMSLVLPKSLVRPVLLMAFLRAELFAWENQQQDSKAEHGRPLRSIYMFGFFVCPQYSMSQGMPSEKSIVLSPMVWSIDENISMAQKYLAASRLPGKTTKVWVWIWAEKEEFGELKTREPVWHRKLSPVKDT